METSEIDLIIKNQISFNLDSIEDSEFEEESSLPGHLLNPENFEWIKTDVLFVIVDAYNRLAHLRYAGKSALEWVLMAGSGLEEVVIKEESGKNIINTLHEIQTEKPYMAVFYSDTPLVDKNLVFKVMDYFTRHRLNAMPLLRGYVFKTDYLHSISSMELSCFEKFDEKAFTAVSQNSVTFISQVLQARVLNYHAKNGIVFIDTNNVNIDAEVEIESGVIIYGNNTVKGESYIGKNVILEDGNKIYNSIICDNAKLCCCKISKSKISNGKVLNMVNLDSTGV